MQVGVDGPDSTITRAGLQSSLSHAQHKIAEVGFRRLLDTEPSEALFVPFNCAGANVREVLSFLNEAVKQWQHVPSKPAAQIGGNPR
jgi:hypothetical protein